MFGKPIAEYLRFERWILALITIVFVVRFASSQAGLPPSQVRWFSINLVLLIGLVYCAVAVHTKRFGAYKQLFGLLLIQNLFAHILIALAIVLGIFTGTDNIFTAPEYFGGQDGKNWFHVIAHGLIWIVPSLMSWAIGSLILFITRKVTPASHART